MTSEDPDRALASTLTLAGPATAADAASYVALGDSYSSAVGTAITTSRAAPASAAPTPIRSRSRRESAPRSAFVACGGADRGRDRAPTRHAQRRHHRRLDLPIGGNDAGFGGRLPGGSPCPRPAGATSTTPGLLIRRTTCPASSTRSTPRSRAAPRAPRSPFVGYPQIRGENAAALRGSAKVEQEELNEPGDMLDVGDRTEPTPTASPSSNPRARSRTTPSATSDRVRSTAVSQRCDRRVASDPNDEGHRRLRGPRHRRSPD